MFIVGKDVAQALVYAKPENAIAIHVDKEDKTTVAICDTGTNYKSKAVLINESGCFLRSHENVKNVKREMRGVFPGR